MMPRADNIANVLNTAVCGILALQAVLAHKHAIVLPKRMVIEVVSRIVNGGMVFENARALFFGGKPERLPHGGLDVGIVNIGMAAAALAHADIIHAII